MNAPDAVLTWTPHERSLPRHTRCGHCRRRIRLPVKWWQWVVHPEWPDVFGWYQATECQRCEVVVMVFMRERDGGGDSAH